MRTALPAIAAFVLITATGFAQPLLPVPEQPLKPAFDDAAPVCGCEDLAKADLAKLGIANTTIDSATVDETGACRVVATVTHPPTGDRVKVYVGLPMKGWNGRFRGTGGGGFVGGNPMSIAGPVAQGFVAGATNTGHDGGSGSFALDSNGRLNWQLIQDNAYLGIHEMTVVGKALTQALYGKAPKYSYFEGFSTGGRQGLVEAQRYPNDYDGIVSGGPAINWPRFIPGDLWPQFVMAQSNNYVPKSKLDAATAAAIAACDADDGITDGVIDQPARCTWDPKAIVGTTVEGSTFTEADAAVIRKIWEGPRRADGSFMWYGVARGTDLSALAKTEGTPLKGVPFGIPHDWFKYFLAQNAQWDFTTISLAGFERLFDQSVEQYGVIFGPDDPNLAAFRDRGGKLVIWHGWSDQLIPAGGAVDYYERVQKAMGGRENTLKFARLFMAPGVAHGQSVGGPVPLPLLRNVIRWVEEGQAPDSILAARRQGDSVVRTRPIYPYPMVAKYKGTGSTDDAANFESAMPAP